MSKYCLFLSLSLIASNAVGQLEIKPDGSTATIDFEQTVLGVNNGSFRASGPPETSPGSGLLDADAWSIEGFNNASDPHEGIDIDGGVNKAGIYAFVVDQDTFLGVQPSTNEFTPGSFTLLLLNQSGGPLNQLRISFELWINNDQPRANALNFLYSLDGINYTQVPALSAVSAATADASGFQATDLSATISLPGVVAEGELVHLRWEGRDVSGVSNRDEFGIDDIQINQAVLPIVWLSFTAEEERSGAVNLVWETASEQNNDRFEVQRRTEGKGFKTIGMVPGGGHATTLRRYVFRDPAPGPGVHYYRLMQYDYDGTAHESVLLSVHTGGKLAIFPTHASHTLQLTTVPDNASWHLWNVLGQRIPLPIPVGKTLDISALKAGQYYLQVIDSKGPTVHAFFKL